MVELFMLRSSDAPWGDYGEILRNGMSQRGEDGVLELLRTGPFVPPISFPWPETVVTSDLGSRLRSQGFSGICLRPVRLRRVVALDWQDWDQAANDPRAYPADGEPENYILKRAHDEARAGLMPSLKEVSAELFPGLQREGGTVEASVYGGHDFCRGNEWGHLYVSKRARDWLVENVGQWVSLLPARVS